jgi:membrane associated rhomboid family serine protease/tetratricopeptide (TPR) repeat protein
MHDENRDDLGREPERNFEPSSSPPFDPGDAGDSSASPPGDPRPDSRGWSAPIAPSNSARRPVSRRAWVASALIGANVAVFAVMVFSGVSPTSPTTSDTLAWGANFGPRIADGELWRLLSAAFVHIGVLHLGMNMIALRSLNVVERLFGSAGFAFIYFASALGASITSVFYHPATISAGASGAVAGLLGALLAFFLLYRRVLPAAVFRSMIGGILLTIGINVVIARSVPFVDNAAHAGGFVTGFVAGLCLYRRLGPVEGAPPSVLVAVPSRKPFVRAALLALAIVASAALLPARIRSDTGAQALILLREAGEALATNDPARAESILDRVIEDHPEEADAYVMRAMSRLRRRRTVDENAAALRDLDRALELDHASIEALDLRRQVRRSQGDVVGELADLDRLVELLPKDPLALSERAHALYAAGRWNEALRDFRRTADLDHDSTGEAQVYAWLAAARIGERSQADAALKAHLRSFSGSSMGEPWRHIALAIIGEGESLSALAQRESDESGAKCRVRFFLASKELLDAAFDAAVGDFERCVTECDADMPEHWSAKAELVRLRK